MGGSDDDPPLADGFSSLAVVSSNYAQLVSLTNYLNQGVTSYYYRSVLFCSVLDSRTLVTVAASLERRCVVFHGAVWVKLRRENLSQYIPATNSTYHNDSLCRRHCTVGATLNPTIVDVANYNP